MLSMLSMQYLASHGGGFRGSSRVSVPLTTAERKDKFLSHCSQISARGHMQIIGDPIGAVEVKVLASHEPLRTSSWKANALLCKIITIIYRGSRQRCGTLWLVPSRLLSFVSGHRTVAGDYYGISAMGAIGRKAFSPLPICSRSHLSRASLVII